MNKFILRDDAINLAIMYKASDEHIASLCKLPGTTHDNDNNNDDNFTLFISTTFTRSYAPDNPIDVRQCVKCAFATKTSAAIIDDSWNYCPKCGRKIYKK